MKAQQKGLERERERICGVVARDVEQLLGTSSPSSRSTARFSFDTNAAAAAAVKKPPDMNVCCQQRKLQQQQLDCNCEDGRTDRQTSHLSGIMTAAVAKEEEEEDSS